METSFFLSLMDLALGELRVTLAVCAVSLLAVWWPLTRGALLCWRARVATRLPGAGNQADVGGRVASLMAEVSSAAEERHEGEHPQAFIRDAARQLVVDDYESSFAQPISMYANILPPIGFIGTTSGLAILLLSMRISHDMLQMGALALALSSTIFALIGYALLESMKIHLYGRLARSIDAGLRGSTA
ncbi:MAG: hypothetical protein CL908_27205 [Deltaproteobacteria bacterium]|jgi:hypothetical protein|nr:hypothetical protein [Deltaproteobacteria bacterium]